MGAFLLRHPSRPAYLYSHFARRIPEEDVQNLVESLITSGQLTEANGRIKYHF